MRVQYLSVVGNGGRGAEADAAMKTKAAEKEPRLSNGAAGVDRQKGQILRATLKWS
jgi:hypothetical protein